MDELLLEKVLRAVEQIPVGQVATYGDVAALVGIGPRHVGNVLARFGGGVTWWRVVNAQGRLPARVLDQAREHWWREGVAERADGTGCALGTCRVDPADLARRYAGAILDLPETRHA